MVTMKRNWIRHRYRKYAKRIDCKKCGFKFYEPGTSTYKHCPGCGAPEKESEDK